MSNIKNEKLRKEKGKDKRHYEVIFKWTTFDKIFKHLCDTFTHSNNEIKTKPLKFPFPKKEGIK
jgi:hypothetical protein